jgi:hypothetical protein
MKTEAGGTVLELEMRKPKLFNKVSVFLKCILATLSGAMHRPGTVTVPERHGGINIIRSTPEQTQVFYIKRIHM